MRRLRWHEHAFSPLCKDEVHGRFDAIEDAAGAIYVLDVGNGQRTADRPRTRKGAIAAARRAAEAWRPARAKRSIPPEIAAGRARVAVVDKTVGEMMAKYGIERPEWVSIWPGWLSLLDETLGKMVAAGWDRRLDEVKGKFCVMLINVDGEPSAKVRAIIRAAADKSAKRCEYCGKPHRLKVPRGGTALCAKCRSEL